jgi:hypothetical protein
MKDQINLEQLIRYSKMLDLNSSETDPIALRVIDLEKDKPELKKLLATNSPQVNGFLYHAGVYLGASLGNYQAAAA